MKATDLMIGDYVTFSDCIDNPPLILIKIEALGYQEGGGEDSSLVRIDNEQACDIIDIDDEIVGIPLTKEILDRNYSRNPGWWFEGTTKYCLRIYADRNAWCLYYYVCGAKASQLQVTIKYVHELQHALKLCGIEKEITL